MKSTCAGIVIPDQIGEEDEGAGQDADEHEVLVVVCPVEPCGDVANRSSDVGLAEP